MEEAVRFSTILILEIFNYCLQNKKELHYLPQFGNPVPLCQQLFYFWFMNLFIAFTAILLKIICS